MLDLRANTIIYQSQAYLVTLVDSLITQKRLGKALNKDWDRADEILSYLEAWEERGKLTDITNMNYVLERLIALCRLNSFPAAPTINIASPPSILFGLPGAKGDKGDTGATGTTGLATDFQISNLTVSSTVDIFDISSAKAARWDYTVIKNTGEQRSGSVVGTWKADGSAIDLFDNSTPDIVGDTSPISFDITYSAPNIHLIATIASGNWSVIGTRYFIPNNGNGSGPVGSVLANGKVYIGNAGNVATAQTLSGAITITNTGVATLGASIITNANIAASGIANIAVNKLAAVTASSLLVSDGSGFISTLSSPTLTQIGYLSNISSDVQVQINNKLLDPTTTNGDLITRIAGVIARVGIGASNDVFSVSAGLPVWQSVVTSLGYTPVQQGTGTGQLGNTVKLGWSGGALLGQVDASPLGEFIFGGNIDTTLDYGVSAAHQLSVIGIRESSSNLTIKTALLAIGGWNMNGVATAPVPHGISPNPLTRIIGCQVLIISDGLNPLVDFQGAGAGGSLVEGYYTIDGSNINLFRRAGGVFDTSGAYVNGGINRGFILVFYKA